MASKKHDKNAKDYPNGEGKIVEDFPPRLSLFAVIDPVPFPNMNVPIFVKTPELAEHIQEQQAFIVTQVLPWENSLPGVGVLALTKKNEVVKVGKGHSIPIYFLSRVKIENIKEQKGFPPGLVFECDWREIEDEEFSQEKWEAPECQGEADLFKNLLVFTFVHLRLTIEDWMNHQAGDLVRGKAELRKMREIFRAHLKRIEEASARIDGITRENLKFAIDEIAGIFSTFLYGAVKSDEVKAEYQRILRQVLESTNTRERMVSMIELMGLFADELEGTTRSPAGDSRALAKTGGKKDADSNLPEYVRDEIRRWEPYANQRSSDAHVHKQYIEWLRSLPWNRSSEDEKDFSKVRRILEEEHLGLEKVKEKILEFLAGRSVKPDAKGSILCLVGPAGVGKTSICKSVSRSTGRKYVRISLGGVDDEAFIRGHARTYIGALPGEIINGLKRAGYDNPVFVFDEIDKLGHSGVHGDPRAALLTVLDPEQNAAFVDKYTNLPFDLSRVLFIATANTVESIPKPLLDRLEVIELPGYTEDQKVAIAEAHTIRKVKKELGILKEDGAVDAENLKKQGMPTFDIRFTRPALEKIAGDYTHDAGMRDQERGLRTILRKVILEFREGKFERLKSANGDDEKTVAIGVPEVREFLGKPKPREWLGKLGDPKPGVGFGLAYYDDGHGGILFVEVSVHEHHHFDKKTGGNIGKVMEESVETAITRLRRHGGALADYCWSKKFIHANFTDGAVPKDGPSAGVMTFCSIYSAMTKVAMKPLFAGTGEIVNERDEVPPVGGIRQKLLGARRAGILEVFIPFANLDDLDDFPKDGVRILTPTDLTNGKTWRSLSLEPKEGGVFTIYCIEKPEDALELAFPDNYPPAKEVTEQKE